jgi:hypothetical protein
MKFKISNRILNIISLLSLLFGGSALLIGLTVHYSYENIDIYENIIKLSAVLLISSLLIKYVQYKRAK